MTIEASPVAAPASSQQLDMIASAAAARTGARGGPYLAHLMGLHTVGHRTVGRRTLRIAPPSPLRPEPSLLTLVAVADIACGAALASHYAGGARMATLALSLHLAGSAAMSAPAVAATARSISVEDAEAAAAVTAYDVDGNALAFGQTSFLHLPPPEHIELQPPAWERTLRASGLAGSLSRDPAPTWTADAVATARRAADAASPGTFWDNFASPDPASWARLDDGRYRGWLPNGMEKRNRVGHTQGGIVFAGMALAANWALRGGPQPGWTLLNGHVRFLRPGVDPALRLECEMLRTGASVSDVLVRLGEPGKEVAVGLFVLEPRSQRLDSTDGFEAEQSTE